MGQIQKKLKAMFKRNRSTAFRRYRRQKLPTRCVPLMWSSEKFAILLWQTATTPPTVLSTASAKFDKENVENAEPPKENATPKYTISFLGVAALIVKEMCHFAQIRIYIFSPRRCETTGGLATFMVYSTQSETLTIREEHYQKQFVCSHSIISGGLTHEKIFAKIFWS